MGHISSWERGHRGSPHEGLPRLQACEGSTTEPKGSDGVWQVTRPLPGSPQDEASAVNTPSVAPQAHAL